MAFFLAVLIVLGTISFAFLTFHVLEGPRLKRMWERVEQSNIDFIRSIMKLKLTATSVLSDYDRNFEVKYLVPYEDQWIWDKLLGRVRLHLYVYETHVGSDDVMDITSQNSKTISRQKYFYMLLKKQVNTEDRKLAIAGLTYLKWLKDIP